MFTIEKTGPQRSNDRLVADVVLNEADFRAIARSLDAKPTRARKATPIAARQATIDESVETHWNGSETTNSAKPGDWIATTLTVDGQVLRDGSGHANQYVISAADFPTLYAPVDGGGGNEFGRFYAARGTVDALRLSGGFDIVAPWGDRQTAADGYLILSGHQVYGNNADTFAATYEVVG
jgi:hypothetical protein